MGLLLASVSKATGGTSLDDKIKDALKPWKYVVQNKNTQTYAYVSKKHKKDLGVKTGPKRDKLCKSLFLTLFRQKLYEEAGNVSIWETHSEWYSTIRFIEAGIMHTI